MKCFDHEGLVARIASLEKQLEEQKVRIKDLTQAIIALSAKEKLYIAILSFLGVIFSTFGSLAGTLIAGYL